MAEGMRRMAEPLDPMEGGLSIDAWMALWLNCHAVTGMGTWQQAWPDGRPLVEQPMIAVEMFSLIRGVVATVEAPSK